MKPKINYLLVSLMALVIYIPGQLVAEDAAMDCDPGDTECLESMKYQNENENDPSLSYDYDEPSDSTADSMGEDAEDY